MIFGEKPQAFLALPFNNYSIDLAKQIGEVLKKEGIEPVLATDFGTGGTFTDQILEAIRKAEYLVADLTGSYPNVLFEVGMAMGLRIPVLLLSQETVKDVPFDLRAHQVAVYRPQDVAAVRRYVEFWLHDVRARRETTAS
jgi:nucleoside 2-deoxyribosyltransferase